MNKRARTRLIGVTAIILIAIVAGVIYSANKQGSTPVTVAAATKDSSLVGKRVKVDGTVIPGSWNKQSNPMKFTVRDESDSAGTGATLKIVYTGAAPSTFGDGVVAIVTGTMGQDGVLTGGEMITKCPSKYASATGALPVGDLLGKGASLVGKPVKATGYVKPGSIAAVGAGDRFVVADKADGTGQTVGVQFSGALPAGMKDGSLVVISGELDQGGKFVATSVALDQSQK